MITITDARITADLREATVFYTVLGDAAAQAATAAALESAKGLLRSTVGKALGLRHSPTLTFVLDDVQDQVKHIDDLLAAARNADAEVQRLAASAKYAGDAQPYRVEDEDDDDGRRGRRRPTTPTATGGDDRARHRRCSRAGSRRPAPAEADWAAAVAAVRGLPADAPGAADLPRQPGRRRAGQHARLRARPAAARRTPVAGHLPGAARGAGAVPLAARARPAGAGGRGRTRIRTW